MDSYFLLAVYMIYYLSVSMVDRLFRLFTEEEREKKVAFSSLLPYKFVFCRKKLQSRMNPIFMASQLLVLLVLLC